MQKNQVYVVYDGGYRVYMDNIISANLLNSFCDKTGNNKVTTSEYYIFSTVTEYCIEMIQKYEKTLEGIKKYRECVDWEHYPIDNEFYNPDYQEKLIRGQIKKYLGLLEKAIRTEKAVLYPNMKEHAEKILRKYERGL